LTHAAAPRPASRPPFSWKRGILHALAGLGLVILAGGILVVTAHPVDPYRFGEGVGRLACFGALVGLGVSALFQRGRKRAGWLVVGAAVALLVALVVVLVMVAPAHPR
jgi:drug/metabolite transporter (DMT)-like permease